MQQRIPVSSQLAVGAPATAEAAPWDKYLHYVTAVVHVLCVCSGRCVLECSGAGCGTELLQQQRRRNVLGACIMTSD
jgi:hypothetical protein